MARLRSVSRIAAPIERVIDLPIKIFSAAKEASIDFASVFTARHEPPHSAPRKYSREFTPPPPMLKKAQARFKEAQRLRQAKLEELEFQRVRFQNVRDFEELRRVFMKTMELTEPESREYNTARKRLHILDVRLKKRRGSR